MPSRHPRWRSVAALLIAGTALGTGCANDQGPARPALTGSLPRVGPDTTLPTLGPDTIPTTSTSLPRGTAPGTAPGTTR